MKAQISQSSISRVLYSSYAKCGIHKVLFEASINGIVTTKPGSGSLPIKDVLVEWQLLGEDNTPLQCRTCHGSVITHKGGSFHIKVKADDERLSETNDEDIPIRIKYSKTTGPINHVFLCNSGDEICDDETGHVEYVHHLNFLQPLHIYDDTSILFSGKVIIDDTAFAGAEGCPISEAKVCLMHNTTRGVEEQLVCVMTDKDGNYEAPVVIGSTVHDIKIIYHDHEFVPTKPNKNNYKAGILVEFNDESPTSYNGHDFRDITKAKLIVEGMCVCDGMTF